MPSLVRVENLQTRTPSGRKLGRPVSFAVEPGELLLIEGENGSGKTTLIKSILGLHKQFNGVVERGFSEDEVAYLPQVGNVQFLLPLTLGDVIELKTEIEGEPQGLLSDPKTFQRSWNTASGGERQKALLSRVFLSQAKLLILDEPFNHLDMETKRRLIALIQNARAQGKAIILISHEQSGEEFQQARHIDLGRPE